MIRELSSALRQHWPEYLMEAMGLGLFMLSASVFGTLLEHPASPVRQALGDPTVRRVLMGLAMGLTAILNIYSPWGQQSGAHLNPSTTLTFLRLGKVARADFVFYALAQFAGASAGILFAAAALGRLLADPAVNFVATLPGAYGSAAAFVAEIAISGLLILVVLNVANRRSLNRYTGLCAGALVMTYITLVAPISGMSMNPARSFGSALPGQLWGSLWIYFLAPPIGMLLAAELYLRRRGLHSVLCAKYHHENDKRCIFRCSYGMAAASRPAEAAVGGS